jgi:hypothetical protein
MFLAVLRIPDAPDAEARAAAATGLALVDVRRRLVGILPRILLVAADRDEIDAAGERLERAGFSTVAFDPISAPSDEDRIVARALETRGDALVAVAGVGVETRHVVPWPSFELIQRGVRQLARREKVTTSTRQLAIGRTILAGGLPVTKKVERTELVARGEDEPFALLHRCDGGNDIILYERRMDYSFLGSQRDSSSRANLEKTVALIATRSQASVDNRVGRPGFVAGIPPCNADPVDVALHLAQLAWRLGRSAHVARDEDHGDE